MGQDNYQHEARRLLESDFLMVTATRIEARYFAQFRRAKTDADALQIWRQVKALRDVTGHIEAAATAVSLGQPEQGENDA